MTFRRTLFAALPLLWAAASASAVTNGDFENGLAGWSTIGDASVYGTAPEGNGQLWLTTASLGVDDGPLAAGALNRSGQSAALVGVANAGDATLASLLLGSGLDDPDNGLYAYEASVAGQVFSAQPGDVLSFRYDFGTRDSYDDYGFVSIDGQLLQLATPASALLAGTNGNLARTGYLDFSYTFGAGSTHQVIFGVVDVGDTTATSTLAIDMVRVSAVPEPQAWIAGLLGLALLAGIGRFGNRDDDDASTD